MTMIGLTKSRGLPAGRRGGGFSFTEVLFAVMVLGIGFIMVAAMFPVTISQTQATMRESVGANLARAAIDYLQAPGVATADNFPMTQGPTEKTAKVLSMPQAFNKANPPVAAGWLATRDNYICAQDPRYAWVPLYMRGRTASGADSPYAQVFVVVVQSRNRPAYIPQGTPPPPGYRIYSDVTLPYNGEPWTALEPHRIQGDPSKPANGVSLAYNYTTVRGEMTFGPDCRHLAGSGAYVIIADDRNTTPPKKDNKDVMGKSNGRIYRLGNPVDEANGVWELAPDGDMIRANYTDSSKIVAGDDNDLAGKDTDAYIIGRGFLEPNPDPSAPPPPPGAPLYGGPAQEIGIYTGFIRISGVTPTGGP